LRFALHFRNADLIRIPSRRNLRGCLFIRIGYRFPRMKYLPLIAMSLGAMIVGCERHDFEETRKLHDKPGLAAPLEEEEDVPAEN